MFARWQALFAAPTGRRASGAGYGFGLRSGSGLGGFPLVPQPHVKNCVRARETALPWNNDARYRSTVVANPIDVNVGSSG